MKPDLPTISQFLSRPIRSVELALPVSLSGKWPWPPKVRTNFAAIRTDEGTLLFNYGLVPDDLLNGLVDDNPWEGYLPEGTLTIFSPSDPMAEREALALQRPFHSSEPFEMVTLSTLFPDAGRIFVPGATACEISYTQTIRDGVFHFDVAGIRIYSSEASTLLERGNGGVLECSIQS